MMCIRCNKRPAIVFVQKMENGEQKSEGYCLSCAREIGIKPVDDLMKQFGISEQDLSGVEDRFASMLGDMDPAELMQTLALQAGDEAQSAENGEDESDEDDKEFTPGGSATFPFGIFGGKIGLRFRSSSTEKLGYQRNFRIFRIGIKFKGEIFDFSIVQKPFPRKTFPESNPKFFPQFLRFFFTEHF